MTTHRIRLRGFWTAQPLDNGLTRWTRSFGSPRSIAPEESVWLAAENLASELPVTLNSILVGHLSPAVPALEVTRLLRPRNLVEIVSATPMEELVLEIRAGYESAT